MAKTKTLLTKMVDTATKYEDAVRVHSIMQRAVDEDRNLQAGKVYELAQSFRTQIREVEPYVAGVIEREEAAKSLLARIGQRLRADVGSEAEFHDLLAEIDLALEMSGTEPALAETAAQILGVAEKPNSAEPQASFGF